MVKNYRTKNKGWRGESHRHSLASKGVKTFNQKSKRKDFVTEIIEDVAELEFTEEDLEVGIEEAGENIVGGLLEDFGLQKQQTNTQLFKRQTPEEKENLKKLREATEKPKKFIKDATNKQLVNELIKFVKDDEKGTTTSLFTKANKKIQKIKDEEPIDFEDILELRGEEKGNIFGKNPIQIRSEVVNLFNEKIDQGALETQRAKSRNFFEVLFEDVEMVSNDTRKVLNQFVEDITPTPNNTQILREPNTSFKEKKRKKDHDEL